LLRFFKIKNPDPEDQALVCPCLRSRLFTRKGAGFPTIFPVKESAIEKDDTLERQPHKKVLVNLACKYFSVFLPVTEYPVQSHSTLCLRWAWIFMWSPGFNLIMLVEQTLDHLDQTKTQAIAAAFR